MSRRAEKLPAWEAEKQRRRLPSASSPETEEQRRMRRWEEEVREEDQRHREHGVTLEDQLAGDREAWSTGVNYGYWHRRCSHDGCDRSFTIVCPYDDLPAEPMCPKHQDRGEG